MQGFIPPPHWGVFTPLVLPPITKYPIGGIQRHTPIGVTPPPIKEFYIKAWLRHSSSYYSLHSLYIGWPDIHCSCMSVGVGHLAEPTTWARGRWCPTLSRSRVRPLARRGSTGATFRRHFQGTRAWRPDVDGDKNGTRCMALTKIALPMTTLNSALRFASLRFASSVKRSAFYCVQCGKKRIVECALLRILC